jgi:hypothetical protein
VVYTLDDPFHHGRPRWETVQAPGGLKYPSSAHPSSGVIWVADTFNHRILAFDLDGRCTLQLGELGNGIGEFTYPVAVAQWRDVLLVAEAGKPRIQAFRVRHGTTGPTATPLPVLLGLGTPWIGKPHGLAVNIADQLAVTDRRHRCIWQIDLAQVLAP